MGVHGRRLGVVALSLSVLAAGVGCSDDDEGRSTTAYCDDLEALGGDEGRPTDHIFEMYGDEPSLAEWAAGLPEAISIARGSRNGFADVAPSEELGDERKRLLAAFDRVIGSFEASLEAARAGDQDAFGGHEVENQDELVPAMDAAMQELVEACGATAE